MYVARIEANIIVVLAELLVVMVCAVRSLVVLFGPTGFLIVSDLNDPLEVAFSNRLLFLAFLKLDPSDWPFGALVYRSLHGLKTYCFRLDALR